jgi:hypothetical protein
LPSVSACRSSASTCWSAGFGWWAIPEFPRGPLRRDGQRQLRIRGVEKDILERLAPHAEARGLTVPHLAGRLLNVIARDGLTDAILDDTGDRT